MNKMTVIHHDCGKPAFRYDNPTTSEYPDPTRAQLLDGTTPRDTDPILCGSCGKAIATLQDWQRLTAEELDHT